ncbi:MAG: metallophosphoesterase [Niastella sp.]|nr:metallophosphoesterase [Niastella sp.]
MNLKVSIIIAFLITLFITQCPKTLGQINQVIIKADVSTYTEKLPVSSDPIWEGTDTLVPLTVNASVPKAMGAEYIIFPFRLDGDSLAPNSDDKRKRPYLWRTKAAIHQQTYTWQFGLDKPCIIRNNSILGGDYLILPGDSIFITYDQGKPVFAGRGAAKFKTQYEMKKASEEVPYPAGEKYPKSLSRFLALHGYFDDQIITALQILDSYKSLLTHYEYDWLKANFLSNVEYYRWLYFYVVPNPEYNPADSFPYSTTDLVKVWDSTMYQSNAKWFRSAAVQNLPGVGGRAYAKSFISTELLRSSEFKPTDTLGNQQIFKKLAYYKIKNDFSGVFRERLLCYFINEEFIQEMGSYSWITQSILQDYYATPGFPAYKKWMKQMETEQRYLSQGKSGGAPLFNLSNIHDSTFPKSRTDGKFTVINFWYTGCKPCLQTARELSMLQKQLHNDPNVIFLNVSIDTNREQWQKSIREGKYVPREGVQLYTGGLGSDHEILRDFHVASVPAIRMYDHTGRIRLDETNPFSGTFTLQQISSAIASNRVINFKDGPYVFHEKNDVRGYYIDKDKVILLPSIASLASATDQPGNDFVLKLQEKHTTALSTYATPKKLLALSDIEGNFGPFRQLLQANKVIDEQYNWTFGNGHLVFAGDMFDRGNQVTECLWLIYSLEEKAKAAGGMVHFILGNHEIMNLQGDHRYVQGKYNKSAELMGKSLTDLYGEDSELGRWLRTKNIVEKIGDMLFTHGGISREINQLPISIEEINQLARFNYDKKKDNYGNEKANIIMSSSMGPFWYREYYNSGASIEGIIDSTLQKFEVSHIITGHTIVADTISVHHSQKVINTDTKHAGGKSEALLVEGGNFYRVANTGIRVLLFRKEQDSFLSATSSRTQ